MSITGVIWNRTNRRWRAVLSGYGHMGYIGEFRTEAEATAARRRAEIEIDGRYHDSAEILFVGEVAAVPLFGRRGVIRGWAVVDAADAELALGRTWCLSVQGYVVGRDGRRILFLHRLVLPGDGVADHISGDKLDCRRKNLRLCTPRENSRNAGPTKGRSLKGLRRLEGGRWEARIMVDRQTILLGRFDEAEDAARAYDAAARTHFGEFARLNFPAEHAGVDVVLKPYALAEAA